MRAASRTYVTWDGLRSTFAAPREVAAGAYWSLIASCRWFANSGLHAGFAQGLKTLISYLYPSESSFVAVAL